MPRSSARFRWAAESCCGTTRFARFRGWHAPTEELLQVTDDAAIGRLDIYDRKPIASWGSERVTLLGDAAHPMLPNVGQGAGQALEDSVVLGKCLSGTDDVRGAIRAYEGQRLKRSASFTKASRMLGAIGRWTNPLVCWGRDRLMAIVLKTTGLKTHEKDMTHTF